MMKPFPLVLAGAICASLLHAQGVVPTDLPPGSPYRVLVVTDSVRDATSTDIADYDAHVAADVAGVPGLAALGVNWRALASTPTVDANVHTATNTPGGVPIYLSNGQRIFDDYEHLWGYPIAPLRAPDVTSSGLTAPVQVWSGTNLSGVASGGLGHTLGAGVNSNLTGFSNVTTFQWLYGTFVLQTEQRPLYGLSDVVTVPGPTYPADLAPGESFRILAVTDSTRDGTSANIADYDALVAADVGAVPAMTMFQTNWRALAATPTVNVKNHTDTNGPGGVPIYRPDGTRVFDDYGHLWGTLINPPLASVDLTLSGQVAGSRVWTGMDAFGTTHHPLGGSSGNAGSGDPSSSIYTWAFANPLSQSSQFQLYALSDVITVPTFAKEEVRPGTPPNPLALLPGQTSAPIIGQTWDPVVDHTNFVANPALDIGVFSNTQANIPHPQFGTILCGQWNNSLSIQPGQAFDIPIANDASLLGAQLTMQCITLDYSWGLHLTNALDITVGSQ